MAGCVGGEEGEVAGGEVDEGVEGGGAGGGEAGGAEDVDDWGAQEGWVKGVGGGHGFFGSRGLEGGCGR